MKQSTDINDGVGKCKAAILLVLFLIFWLSVASIQNDSKCTTLNKGTEYEQRVCEK